MKEKFDVDGEQLTNGIQVALLDTEDPQGPPILLLKVADLQQHTPLIKVQVVELLKHHSASWFRVGEIFETLPRHLSRRLAAQRRPA